MRMSLWVAAASSFKGSHHLSTNLIRNDHQPCHKYVTQLSFHYKGFNLWYDWEGNQMQKWLPAQWYHSDTKPVTFDSANRHSWSKSKIALPVKHFLSDLRQDQLSIQTSCSDEQERTIQDSKGLALTHPFACAHLAVSMAAWLPLEGRQRVQQEDLVPHFL